LENRWKVILGYALIFMGVYFILSASVLFVFAIIRLPVLPGLVAGGVIVLMFGGGGVLMLVGGIKLRKKHGSGER